MALRKSEPTPCPADRRRQIASILAKGVTCWLRRAKRAGIIDAQESSPAGENGLELLGETSLTVSNGTRGFTPRGDGDNV